MIRQPGYAPQNPAKRFSDRIVARAVGVLAPRGDESSARPATDTTALVDGNVMRSKHDFVLGVDALDDTAAVLAGNVHDFVLGVDALDDTDAVLA